MLMQNDPYNQQVLPEEPDSQPPYQQSGPGNNSDDSSQKLILGVVIGLFTGILLTIAGFTIYNNFFSADSSKSNSAQTDKSESKPEGSGVVDKDDLKAYNDTEAKDCSQEVVKYNNLKLAVSKYAMKSVNLDSQKVTMVRELYDGSKEDISIQWKTMPDVVDANCEKITFADVKVGDYMNLYTSLSDMYLDSGTKLYQRTTDWR